MRKRRKRPTASASSTTAPTSSTRIESGAPTRTTPRASRSRPGGPAPSSAGGEGPTRVLRRATGFMKGTRASDGMVKEPLESPLLLELARDAFRRQIATRVRPLARSYVEKWMACELWLYPSVIRSEEHTSELQSQSNLVCRLLLEKKKRNEQQMLLRIR